MCVVAEKQRQKEEEAGITDVVFQSSSQDSTTMEERLQLHRDSASTLNRDSSTGAGSTTHSYELHPTECVGEVMPSTASLSVAVASEPGASNMEEGNSQQVCAASVHLVGVYR